MAYPNIRSRRENFFNHWISPMQNRNNFLHRNPMDSLWLNKKTPVNIKKDNELFEMKLAMPGFEKSELSITLNGGILTVKGEKTKLEAPINQYILQEFNLDIMERKFKLAENIEKEKIEAKYENGILYLKFVDVPAPEESYVKKIIVE